MYEFVIRGARGTLPTFGEQYLTYGGNTSCFTLKTEAGYVIFDAGTGISNAAKDILAMPVMPAVNIFFTHLHIDHLIGLPAFAPLYHRTAKIMIMADPERQEDWKQAVRNFTDKPYWPVGLGEGAAVMNLEDLPIEKGELNISGIKITWFRMPHPQGSVAYKIAMPSKTIVLATDVEYTTKNIDPAFINFCRNANFLIFDAQYTPKEYEAHIGWGHSTWKVATQIASEAKVDQLILTHHDPDRIDKEIDKIIEEAKKVHPNTCAAKEDMVV